MAVHQKNLYWITKKRLYCLIIAKLKKAKELLDSILEKNPNFDNAYVMIGKIQYYDHEFTRAENSFSTAYELNDYNLEALFWRAKTRSIQNNEQKTRDALVDLNKVLEMNNTHIEAWYLKGLIHEKHKEINKAIHAYKNAISIGQKLSLVHLQLGMLYHKAELPTKAEPHFRSALMQNSDPKMLEKIKAMRHISIPNN